MNRFSNIRAAARVFLTGMSVFSLTSLAFAAPPRECAIALTELQPGVNEVDFGNVMAKFEDFNKVAKMKMLSALNSDWTSVSTEGGLVGQISGFKGNGSDAELIAELIVVQREEGFDWAMFRKDPRSLKGAVTFLMEGHQVCFDTTVTEWRSSIRKAFGEIRNVAFINLERDSL